MTFLPAAGPSASRGPGAFGAVRMTPGRWLALAVAVPVAVALIGWTGFSIISAVARGSYPFSYQVPVQHGQVAVNVNAGSVTLRRGSGSTAMLTGVVQYNLVRPSIDENTTSAGADLGVNCGGISGGNCGMNATLDVPARTAVMLSSDGGDIGVSGFTSNMTLSAVGGNVTASNLVGDLRMDTGGGDLTGSGLTGSIQLTTEGGNVDVSNVTASNVDGPIRMDTGGGDLNANGLTGSLQLLTEGGNIDSDAAASPQVTIDSGGGDVTLALTEAPQKLQITAEGGNVTVILPHGDTKYAISTPDTQGGNVSYPSTLVSSTSPHKISIDSGGGDISVTEAG